MGAMVPHCFECPGSHERSAQRRELGMIVLPAGVHVSAGAAQSTGGAAALAGDVEWKLLQRLQHVAITVDPLLYSDGVDWRDSVVMA